MTVSMYTISIPVFIQHLGGLNTVLDKAAAWTGARKVNEADLIEHATVAGHVQFDAPGEGGDRSRRQCGGAAFRQGAAEIRQRRNDDRAAKDRIAKTVDYLKSIKQSEIDGTEAKDISITFPSGQTRQFTGQSRCSVTACRISGFTPPPPTTSFGSAALRSASATSWARRRRRKAPGGAETSCR